MELRHLRYFVAVAQTCHFGQAADQLHVAQPALSQAIRQLEAELGATLFNRTTRQVALTPAGEFLLREARQVLATLEDSVEGVHRIAEGRDGLIRLGMVGTASFSHLPTIARILKRELPGLALEVRADLLTPAQCDAVRDGSLDIALLRPPVSGDHLALRRVATEPLVLALPADHRLVGEPIISVSDLRAEPFVTYSDRDSAVNQATLRACRTAGFAPMRSHEAPSTAVLLSLVAAGLGLAMAPASVRALQLGGVVFHDLHDGGSVDLCLAWRDDSSDPLVERVVSLLAASTELSELSRTFAGTDPAVSTSGGSQ